MTEPFGSISKLRTYCFHFALLKNQIAFVRIPYDLVIFAIFYIFLRYLTDSYSSLPGYSGKQKAAFSAAFSPHFDMEKAALGGLFYAFLTMF